MSIGGEVHALLAVVEARAQGREPDIDALMGQQGQHGHNQHGAFVIVVSLLLRCNVARCSARSGDSKRGQSDAAAAAAGAGTASLKETVQRLEAVFSCVRSCLCD